MRQSSPLLLFAAVSVLGSSAASAATLYLDLTLSFESHGTYYLRESNNTSVGDTYRITTPGFTIPIDTYEDVVITYRPEGGKRFSYVPNPDGINATFWSIYEAETRDPSTAAIESVPFEFTFENGSGSLPGTYFEPLSIGFAPGGGKFRVTSRSDFFTGPFTFDALILTADIPDQALGGAFVTVDDRLTMRYSLPGDAADPGRFTFLVPEPASAALLGLSGLALLGRRRRSR